MIFALVGNQNCGKTTLFNALTGSNQHVGNFPGVTVDQKMGEILSLIHISANAPPASTRVASAHCKIRLSSRRSSSFKRPTAFSRPAPRRELEQHSSAKYSVVWAGVIFSGFIS